MNARRQDASESAYPLQRVNRRELQPELLSLPPVSEPAALSRLLIGRRLPCVTAAHPARPPGPGRPQII